MDITLTDLEKEMIVRIGGSVMSISAGCPECAKDTCTLIWEAIDDDPRNNGVLTSLIKKNLAVTSIDKRDPDDSSVELTEQGFDLYIELIKQ